MSYIVIFSVQFMHGFVVFKGLLKVPDLVETGSLCKQGIKVFGSSSMTVNRFRMPFRYLRFFYRHTHEIKSTEMFAILFEQPVTVLNDLIINFLFRKRGGPDAQCLPMRRIMLKLYRANFYQMAQVYFIPKYVVITERLPVGVVRWLNVPLLLCQDRWGFVQVSLSFVLLATQPGVRQSTYHLQENEYLFLDI